MDKNKNPVGQVMELYKIVQPNKKHKKMYSKNIAFGLMDQMKVGEKFYFDVTEERARQWCEIFRRKRWRYYRDAPLVYVDDNAKRRHLVKFKVCREGALRCIKKVDDRLVYTDKKYISQFKENYRFTIEDAEFSVRTHNCLTQAGFKHLEALVHMTDRDLLKYKNMGLKSIREIRKKLVDLKLINEEKSTNIKEEIKSWGKDKDAWVENFHAWRKHRNQN
tara:strand:+ start:24 stop:683 length:660 start_codon:yes stop_codon:yes gene_type:complete